MQETTSVPTASGAAAPSVDRLELIQEMPRGSVGTVQKARNARTQLTVALRQFDVPQWLDDVQALLDKIVGEAKAASQLQHPNIAALYTCGYKDFTVFMTSEFVDAPTVKELMATRTPTLPEAAALAKQLCAAMDYAHSKGVV